MGKRIEYLNTLIEFLRLGRTITAFCVLICFLINQKKKKESPSNFRSIRIIAVYSSSHET